MSLSALFPCFAARKPARTSISAYPNEKVSLYAPESEEDRVASRLLSILLTAEKPGKALKRELENEVSTTGWTDGIIKKILAGLEKVIHEGKVVGGAVGEAHTHSHVFAKDFVSEHPVFTAVIVTVVALGILYLLWPWALGVLGFGEMGPIEGSWAAWFQTTYGPEVPAGSLFSALQHLAMTVGK